MALNVFPAGGSKQYQRVLPLGNTLPVKTGLIFE
jgi:hypothetical protein